MRCVMEEEIVIKLSPREIEKCLKENDYETAKTLCEKLEMVVDKMK